LQTVRSPASGSGRQSLAPINGHCRDKELTGNFNFGNFGSAGVSAACLVGSNHGKHWTQKPWRVFAPMLLALYFRQHRKQTKMIHKGNEISVNEKQWQPSFYTESSDDNVRRFADSDSFLAKRAIVICTLLGHTRTKHLNPVQRQQCLFGFSVLAVISNALENFEENQIPNGNGPFDDSEI
jgi:hypothetical protein